MLFGESVRLEKEFDHVLLEYAAAVREQKTRVAEDTSNDTHSSMDSENGMGWDVYDEMMRKEMLAVPN